MSLSSRGRYNQRKRWGSVSFALKLKTDSSWLLVSAKKTWSTCWHSLLQIILMQSQKYIYLCILKAQTTAYCCSAVQYDQNISEYKHFWSSLCWFSNCLISANCRGEGVCGCHFNQNKMSIQIRIGKDKFKNHLEWIYDVCYTQMWKLLLRVPKIKRCWINYWIRNVHRQVSCI